MSTYYFVKETPITVSNLMNITGYRTNESNVQIEIDESNGEWERTKILLDPSELNPRKTHSLRIRTIFNDEEKPNYLFVFVEKKHLIHTFGRYGNNQVSDIISLIEYYCDTTIIDEYKMNDLNHFRHSNTVTLVYQNQTERKNGLSFVRSLNKEVNFFKVEPKDFRLDSPTLDKLSDLGRGVWFKSIDQFVNKSEMLSNLSEYFGSTTPLRHIDIYEDKAALVDVNEWTEMEGSV